MALSRAHHRQTVGKQRHGARQIKSPDAVKGLYAALDLGTNSCRMLIAKPDGLNFAIVDAFSKSVRLGSDLERTGILSQGGVSRTLQALHVCSRKIRKIWCSANAVGCYRGLSESEKWKVFS